MSDPASKLPTKPDESPPRNRFIAFATLTAVSTLIVLKFVFDSYFDTMMTDETQVKAEAAAEVAGADVARARDHEAQLLTGGPMPIDRAMDQMAHGGRTTVDLIRPQASHDLGPQKGWDHLPDFVSSANVHLELAPAAPAGAPAVPPPAAPAGVIEGTTVGDGIAPPALGTEGAGAPAAPPPVVAPSPAAPPPAAPPPAVAPPAAPPPAAPAPHAVAPAPAAHPARPPAAPRPAAPHPAAAAPHAAAPGAPAAPADEPPANPF